MASNVDKFVSKYNQSSKNEKTIKQNEKNAVDSFVNKYTNADKKSEIISAVDNFVNKYTGKSSQTNSSIFYNSSNKYDDYVNSVLDYQKKYGVAERGTLMGNGYSNKFSTGNYDYKSYRKKYDDAVKNLKTVYGYSDDDINNLLENYNDSNKSKTAREYLRSKYNPTNDEIKTAQEQYNAYLDEQERLKNIDLNDLQNQINNAKNDLYENPNEIDINEWTPGLNDGGDGRNYQLYKLQKEYNLASDAQNYAGYENTINDVKEQYPDVDEAMQKLLQHDNFLGVDTYRSFDHSEDGDALYRSLQQQYGAKQVNDWYDAYKRVDNRNKSEDVQFAAKENAIFNPGKASIESVGQNIISGVGYLDVAGQKLINPDAPVDYYRQSMNPYYQSSAARQTVASNLQNQNLGGVKSFLYETGMSMADSAVIAGLSSVGVPPIMATSLLGGSAATSSMMNAKQKGVSDEQALITGLAAGTAETLFEYLSLDKLLKTKALTGTFKDRVIQTAKNMAIQGGVEGSEEFFTDLANNLTDYLINGGMSDYNQAIEEYVASGMSRSDAEKNAQNDLLKQFGLSFAGGFVSGLGFGSVGTVASTINQANITNQYGKMYNIDNDTATALVDEALEINPENKQAQRAKKKLDAGKSVSNITIRDLVDTNERAIDAETKQRMETASKNYKGVEEIYAQNKPSDMSESEYDSSFKYVYDYGKAFANTRVAPESIASELSRSNLPKTLANAVFSAAKNVAEKESFEKIKVSANKPATGVTYKNQGVFDDRILQTRKLTDSEKTRVDFLRNLSKVTGVNITFVESEKVDDNGNIEGKNGSFNPNTNTIEIDVNAWKNNVNQEVTAAWVRTASHEFTHYIRNNSETMYNELKDFVLTNIMDTNLDIETLVDMKKNRSKNKDLSTEDAIEEIIADSCENMLYDSKAIEKLATENKTLFDSILEWIHEFVAKVKNAFADEKALESGSIERKALIDKIEELQEIWDNALVNAVQNSGYTMMTNENGQDVGIMSDNGTIMLSARTYDEGGRANLEKYLNGQVKQKNISREDANDMLESLDDIRKVCEEFLNLKDENGNAKYGEFGEWSRAEVKVDPETGKAVFSVVKKNGEYSMNLDFSLVCKKRRTLDAVFNEMIKDGIMDDFKMGQTTIAAINDIIRDNGFETACALCFVDSKRYRQAIVADSFVSIYNKMVRSMAKEGQKIDIFNFGGNRLVANVENGIDTLSDKELNLDEIKRVIKESEKDTVELKVAKHLLSHPKDRKLLMRGDFMSTAGLDNVRQYNQNILKLYNAKKGAGGPKAAQSDVQYLSEILAPNKFSAKRAYNVGGVRIQSFSDYIPRLVFDYVQMIADMSAKKLPAHAYTKEPMFILQFGLTGIKGNMSLVPDVLEDGVAPGLDKDGNYAWRDGQSFGSTVYGGSKEFIKKCFDIIGKKYNGQDRLTAQEGFLLACAIQNDAEYGKHNGTIAVGVSDEHIRKLLRDENIRMVIPYHKSSLNHLVAVMTNVDKYKNYTDYQNTRKWNAETQSWVKLEKDTFNFNEKLHKLDLLSAEEKAKYKYGGTAKDVAHMYLDYCDKHGYKPKFDDFRNEENYYKLLEDFDCYNMDGTASPQAAIKLNLPTDANLFGSFKEIMRMGLDEDALLQAKQDKAVPVIVEQIKQIIHEFEKSIYEEQENYYGNIKNSERVKEDDIYTLPNGKKVNAIDYLNSLNKEGEDFIYTYKSMSYWGKDENGNAILRSPMAEFSSKNKNDISGAYIVSSDKNHPNWYKAEEDPSKLFIKVKSPGKKTPNYIPMIGNDNLVADDWSNLYYPLIKKNELTGSLENPTYARYNPYEHSSNKAINDQFDAGYRRPNLVTVKMKVPLSEQQIRYRADYSKDPTGWTGWKSGKVAGKISEQKPSWSRDVYLSRYSAPVEIMPNSWVAKQYKEYIEGTDVEVPDNVVSADLLNELKKAGVPIKDSGRLKSLEGNKPESYVELERLMKELKEEYTNESARDVIQYSGRDSNGNELSKGQVEYFKESKVRDDNGNLIVLYHGTVNGGFNVFDTGLEGTIFASTSRYVALMYSNSDNYSDAKDYDSKTGYGNIYNLYANLTNPLVVDGNKYNKEKYDKITITYDDRIGAIFAKRELDGKTNTKKIYTSKDTIGSDLRKHFDEKTSNMIENQFDKDGYFMTMKKPKYVVNNKVYFENTSSVFDQVDFEGKLLSTDQIASIAKERGYDGVIIKNVIDDLSFSENGISATDVIAFDSNQVKLTSNKNPSSSNDIRYSERDALSIVEEQNKYLAQRLEEVKKQRDYWKRETTINNPATAKAKDIHKIASEFTKDTNLVIADVEPALQKLADYMMGDDVSYAEARNQAIEIASDIVRNTKEVVEDIDLYRDYKALRKELHSTKIYVPESVKKSIYDWNDFRKAHMGKFILTNTMTGAIGIDTLYEDLSERYGLQFFPDTIDTQDEQFMRIADVIDTMEPAAENPYSYNMEEATGYIASDIIDRLLSEDVGQAEKTRAQKMYDKLKEEAYTRKENAIKRERATRERQLKRLKQHYADANLAAAQRKGLSEDRQKLLRIAKRLQNKKLPSVTKALLNQYIGELDTVSVGLTGRKVSELTSLRDWYDDQLANNPDYIRDERIEKQIARLSKKHIKEMSQEDVQILTEVLLNIENEYRTAKKLIDSQYRHDIYVAGQQIESDVLNADGNKNSFDKFLNSYIVNNELSPIRMIRHLTGYNDADPLYIAGNELSDGQRTMIDYQRRAEEIFSKYANNKKFTDMMSGKKAEEIEVEGFTGYNDDGSIKKKKVKITPSMRVALYMHSLNADNMRHIMYGGMSIPDITLYKNGKISEAYNNDVNVKFTPSQIKEICSHMTKDEMEYANAIKKYFKMSQAEINNVSEKLKGYSLAQVENYFPITADPNFLVKDLDTVKFDGSVENMGFTKDRTQAKNAIILNGADIAVSRAIQQHSLYVGMAIPIRNMSKLLGAKDGNWVESPTSVKKAITSKWGEEGFNYIADLLGDLQNNNRKKLGKWGKALNKLRSNYAGATLSLNPGVALKQAASYPTAASVVGFDALGKAFKEKVTAEDLAIIDKYTPLLWYRKRGFTTKENGDISKNPGFMNNVMSATVKIGGKNVPVFNWIQGMDVLTTTKLWKAAEFYVRDKMKMDKRNGDAYYKEVAKVYNRIIEETQPNYTTMQRPSMLRSQDTLLQTLSMFKTQPFQNFNVLYDAAFNLKAKKKAHNNEKTEENAKALKQAQTDWNRAWTSQVVQTAVFSAITMAWSLLRGKKDDYDDDEGNVTFFSAALGVLKSMIGNTFGNVFLGSEIYSYAMHLINKEKFYGIESATVQAMNDIFDVGDYVISAFDAIGDKDYTKARLKLQNAVTIVSQTVGIPAKNIINLFNMFYLRIASAANGSYCGEFSYALLTTDVSNNKKQWYDTLYKLYKSGDKQYDKLKQMMIDSGEFDTEKKTGAENIQAAINERVKANNK